MACKLAVNAAGACAAALPDTAIPPAIWQAIITAVLGMFGGCMQPPTPAKAQEDAAEDYNEASRTYGRGTVRIAARHAMRAAKQAGSRLSRDEAFTVAPIILNHIRTAPPDDMAEAYKACMAAPAEQPVE